MREMEIKKNNMNDLNENNYGTSDALRRLEEQRTQVAKSMRLVMIGAFCLLIPPIGLAVIFFAYSKLKKAQDEMKVLYKEAFVREPLEKNFEDVIYEPSNGFTREVVQNCQLCRMGNRFYSEDYIRASYMGVPFEMADVNVWDVDKSDDKTYTTTYFKGRMIFLNFPDKVVSSVMLYSKSFKYRGISKKDSKQLKVELEGVQFNNEFDVFSPVPHDAFYLLTPQVMERLQKLDSQYQSIAINVVGNSVVLAFNEPDNNAFDSKTTIGNVNVDEEMAKVQSDIDDIKLFISAILNSAYTS